MKNGAFRIVVILLSFLSVALAWSQDNGEVTAEERYFSNPRTKFIREQAMESGRDSKLLAIDSLKEMLNEGGVQDGDRDVHAILDYLALEGSKIKIFNGSAVTNNFADVRMSACNLLGKLGGENSMRTLIEVIGADADYSVMAESFISLGKIGLNPKNEVLVAMSSAMMQEDLKGPKHNLALAYLTGIRGILDETGTINESSTFNMLNRIIMLNMYGKKIQQQARDLQLAIKKANK